MHNGNTTLHDKNAHKNTVKTTHIMVKTYYFKEKAHNTPKKRVHHILSKARHINHDKSTSHDEKSTSMITKAR